MAILPAGFVADEKQPELPAGFVPDAQQPKAEEAPAASPEKPGFLEEAGNRVAGVAKPFVDLFANATLPTSWQDVKDRLRQNVPAAAADIGNGLAAPVRGVLAASGAVGNAVAHPVATFGGGGAGAAVREGLRGAYSNLPLVNLAVEHAGGPEEVSPEDAARAPGFRELGALGGAALVGKTAAAGAEKAAGALERAGAAVESHGVEKAFKQLGKGAGEARAAKLEAVGPEAIRDVNREFKILDAPDPRVAIAEAKGKVGAARDAAYKAIDTAGGGVDMSTVTKNLDDLQATFSKHAGTRPFASDVAELRTTLLKQYGDTGKVPVAALQEEVSSISSGAYGGSYSNPKAGAIVQKRTASALRGALDDHLDAVAKTGEQAKDAVDAFYEANGKFQALKAMEPIVKAKTIKARFSPGMADKLIDKPLATLAHTAKDIAGERAAHGLPGALQGGAANLRGVAPVVAAPAVSGAFSPDAALRDLVARAGQGDDLAKQKLAQLAQAPIVAARISALQRQAGM